VRLFTAIELTGSARAAIVMEQKNAVEALGPNKGDLRLVRPEQMHLTLVFIGDVSDGRGAAIADLMTGDIPIRPFTLGLGGLGAFPARGAPRVLYVDVVTGMSAAIDLHGAVSARLARAGVRRDERPFHPHLTLGRWRESRPSDRPRASARTEIAIVEVDRVTLFQSRLSSSGSAYTRLASSRLVSG
jgi:RNA 2',3'-cyclic 3'-phosphodiesterase